MIVGLIHDHILGGCILVGMGGILAEVIHDVSFRALPIDLAQAKGMVDDLQAHQVLEGFRNRPVDKAAVLDLLVKVSNLNTIFHNQIDQLDLNPVIVHEKGLSVVDAKLIVRSRQEETPYRGLYSPSELKPILYPRAIAVIGASENPHKFGGLLIRNLLEGGFPGRIYPINPNADRILGVPARKTVGDYDEDIDLAFVVIPSNLVPAAVRECAEKGIKGVAICSGGFAELGPQGEQLTQELEDVLRSHDIRVLGPNMMGILNMNCNLLGAFAIEALIPRFYKGRIGLITQSGSIGTAFLQNAGYDGLGFSLHVALGNRVDIDEADWIRFMNEDPTVTVIALQLEGIKCGARFLDALRMVTKPMVILKTGRTSAGAKAVASHSVALSANDRVFAGVLKQYNILRAETVDEFYDLVKTLTCLGSFKVRRLLVIETSGGLGIIAADQAEQAGLELPQLGDATIEQLHSLLPAHSVLNNPLDLASIDAQLFEGIAGLGLMSRYDALLLIFGDPVEGASRAVQAFLEGTTKPILVAFSGGGEIEAEEKLKIMRLGVPVFPTVERAMTYFRFCGRSCEAQSADKHMV
jgi:acyl-CoA synthetase (NDP forming)